VTPSGLTPANLQSAYALPSSTAGTGQTVAVVDAFADSATGVAVFQTFGANGWVAYGGTSVASPIIASVYALAGGPAAGSNPVALRHADPGGLNDVTSGSNGNCGTVICTAGTGWDGPTGLGTPNGSPRSRPAVLPRRRPRTATATSPVTPTPSPTHRHHRHPRY
jgi:hypothetical protein